MTGSKQIKIKAELAEKLGMHGDTASEAVTKLLWKAKEYDKILKDLAINVAAEVENRIKRY
jgi:hypothetical protein